MNTKRIALRDLTPGDQFTVSDYGTVYQVVKVTTWTPNTTVRYFVVGEAKEYDYTSVCLSTVDKLV